MTAGGNYIASNNVVLWGPFFGTNALALSYRGSWPGGNLSGAATWSVDGVGGSEAVGTNIVVASAIGSASDPAAARADADVVPCHWHSNLPVNVSISSSDPQAQIYFTTDGSLPTQSSTPYTRGLNFSAQTTCGRWRFARVICPAFGGGQLCAGAHDQFAFAGAERFREWDFSSAVTITATPWAV